MKVSIKHTPIGKPVKTKGAAHSFKWIAVDISPLELVQHICSGKPFAVGQYRRGHRSRKNFICSDLIALDYDQIDGQPISDAQYQAIIDHPYIQKNAFAVIETFSSQQDARRFRVLFRLSRTITDADLYSELVAIVIKQAPSGADTNAIDAARAFYGSQPDTKPSFQSGGGE